MSSLALHVVAADVAEDCQIYPHDPGLGIVYKSSLCQNVSKFVAMSW